MEIIKEEQQRAIRALPEAKVNNGRGQENGQRSSCRANAVKLDGAQGDLVSDDPAAHGGYGASNGTYYYGELCCFINFVGSWHLVGDF